VGEWGLRGLTFEDRWPRMGVTFVEACFIVLKMKQFPCERPPCVTPDKTGRNFSQRSV
jgi:hypothetical protein